jgi:hypothetical protein
MQIKDFFNRYIQHDNYSFLSCYYELKELLSATSYDNFWEELNDVCFTFQVALYANTKLNFPMFWSKPSIAKMEDRLIYWTDYFNKAGLTFKPIYWRHGSNYKKAYKLDRGIQLAIEDYNKEIETPL